MVRRFTSVFVGVGFIAASGCSISASSESISNSISSPFEWSKSSSESSSGGNGGSEDESEPEPEPQHARDAYSRDVTELAATYGTSGGDIGALRGGISRLAAQRGITNWEVDPLTCTSIGRGMRQAGVDEQAFSAFSNRLFGDDLAKSSALRTGYRGAGQ